MIYHVAFLQKDPLMRMQAGIKTVECRLSKVLHPARHAHTGDALLFKAVGGDITAMTMITHVDHFHDLRPCDVQALAELTSPLTGGDPHSAYWQIKQSSRYAVLIHFGAITPVHVLPAYTPRGVMSGWTTIDIPAYAIKVASRSA